MAGGKPLVWTARPEKIHDDILLIHDALPKVEELPGLAERFEASFQSSTIVGEELSEYTSPDHRVSSELQLADGECPDELLFYGLICKSIEGSYITAYNTMVNPHAVVKVSSGYSLLRYRERGFFGEHVDVTRDHPVLGHRRLSTVVFCNDDFEGGGLKFPRQGLTVEPEPGLMVLFPSGFTHPHEALPVSTGTKYSIVAWYF